MFPSLVMALNKPAPTSYWGNSSVVICWEDSFTWVWWNKKRRLACIYNVLIEVTHLIVYIPTSIIFEVLPHTWIKTPNHNIWNITFPMFDLHQLYIWMQALGHKLWSTSRCWPPSTLFLNEYSWPLIMRYFLIFDLSQSYIECKLSIIRFEVLLDPGPPSTVYLNEYIGERLFYVILPKIWLPCII